MKCADFVCHLLISFFFCLITLAFIVFFLWNLRVFSNFWNLRLNRPFVWKIKRILQTFRRFLSFLVQNLECKCEINYSDRMVTNDISDAKLFIIPRYFYRRIEFLNHNVLYEFLSAQNIYISRKLQALIPWITYIWEFVVTITIRSKQFKECIR